MSEPLVIIIDGNNLAHYLFQLSPGLKLSLEHIRHLVLYLEQYASVAGARSADFSLKIELCLDYIMGDIQIPLRHLSLIAADYPFSGDDEVLQRFWFHAFRRDRNIVITNDEEILEEVKQADGNSLSVFQFVRMPSWEHPVFLQPDDFPPIHIPDIDVENELLHRHWGASIFYCKTKLPEKPSSFKKARPGSQEKDQKTVDDRGKIIPGTNQKLPSSPGSGSRIIQAPQGEEGVEYPNPPEPVYRLTLDYWPVELGAKFLLHSFCISHRADYFSLMSNFDLTTLRSSDLRILADFLLSTCGQEADFARRGSLMDRIRLALLREKGEWVSLSQLAELIDLKAPGLQGRIKEKAKPWIEVTWR